MENYKAAIIILILCILCFATVGCVKQDNSLLAVPQDMFDFSFEEATRFAIDNSSDNTNEIVYSYNFEYRQFLYNKLDTYKKMFNDLDQDRGKLKYTIFFTLEVTSTPSDTLTVITTSDYVFYLYEKTEWNGITYYLSNNGSSAKISASDYNYIEQFYNYIS